MKWPINDWLATNGRLDVKTAGPRASENNGLMFVSMFLPIESTGPGHITETE
jgi:hypothetical protein